MKKLRDYDKNTLGVLGLICAVILFLSINIVSVFTLKNYRTDLTQAKLYSLSQGSKQAVAQIREPITIRFYLSGKLAQVSQLHASYSIRVIELLEQYATASNGKIKLEILDPEPFSKNEDEALTNGIKGIPVGNSSEYVYFGMTITNSSDRKRTITLLDPSRERFLEYDITKYLTDLTRAKRPTVGIISTLPIDGRGEPGLAYPKYHPRWAIMKQIREIFNVRFISRQTLDIPADIDVLMIVNPKKFNDETLYAIDQYVMRGGNVLIMIDPFSETEVALGEVPYTIRPDMEKLFERWGISFEPTKFVADMTLARTVTHTADDKSTQVKFTPWLELNPSYLSPEDPVTGALSSVNLAYSGYFNITKKIPDLLATPLMFSSKESQVLKNTSGIDPDPERFLRTFEAGGKNFVLGLRLKGNPESAFDKAPERNFLKQRTETHIQKSLKPVNIILIADSDFMADKFWAKTENMLGVDQIYPFAGNADLIINALDNLSGATSLIDLRSKAEWRRPFTVLEDMALQSGKRYREQETKLYYELTAAQKKLQTLTERADKDADELLTREDRDEMDALQKRVMSLRSSLRAVQTVLSSDITALQSLIVMINVLLVPALLVVIALFVAWRKHARRRLGNRKG